MKRQLLTLSAACLCSLSVNAKNEKTERTDKIHLEKMTEPRTAGKTTNTESRLVGEAQWYMDGNTFAVKDSSYMTYSPNNGWDHVHRDWRYNEKTNFYNLGSGLDKTVRTRKTFDAKKRIAEELGDSWNGISWFPVGKTVYTYNSFGTIVTSERQSPDGSSWFTYSKDSNTYDAQGRIIEELSQDNNSGPTGTLQNTLRTLISYNGQGLRNSTSIYAWDAANSNWTEDSHTFYFYTDSLLTSFVPMINTAGGWTKGDSTVWTYDSDGQIVTVENKKNVGGIWIDNDKAAFAYDASGNRISATYAKFDGISWQPSQQVSMTYNNFGQVLKKTVKTWDATSNSFVMVDGDNEDHYYYEQFTNGVTGISATNASLHIYPNPAATTINLKLDWNETQPATILLFDITGKVAGQWSTPADAQHMQTLDISNVPAGTYMLKVMGTKEALSQKVNIVK